MKQKKINSILTLCQTDLSREMLLPYLLREIRKTIGCYSSTFFTCQENYQFINVYDELPSSFKLSDRYFNYYLDNHDIEARPRLRNLLKNGQHPISHKDFVFPRFYQSGLFYEILRPLNYYKTLYVPIMHINNPIGILMIHRDKNCSDFSLRTISVVDQIRRKLAIVLSDRNNQNSEYSSFTTSEHFTLSEDGELLDFTENTPMLLARLKYKHISAIKRSLDLNNIFPEEFLRFFNSVRSAPSSSFGSGIKIHNQWERYLISYRGRTRIDDNHSFTIQPLVPHQIKAYYSGENFGLTPKQIVICMKLVNGYSYADIGKALHVEVSTVVDHINNIKLKLNVSGKVSIVLKLLGES